MSKNVIHNFNLSIQNSADIKSSEDLTETIIKELAKVSKEMSQQKDIVQEWQEQKNQNTTTILNNSNASTEGGAKDSNAETIKKTAISMSNTSSVSEETIANFSLSTNLTTSAQSALIGGGVIDTTDRTTINSPTSDNTTVNLNNGTTTQTYANVAAQQTLIVPEVFQTNNNEPSPEAIKAEIKKKLELAIGAKNTVEIKYWTRISKAFEKGARVQDFDGKPEHELFTKMYFGLKKWRLTAIDEVTTKSLNWVEVSESMLAKLYQLLKESDDKKIFAYYKRLIREIKNPDVNIQQLFSEHEELFVLLKSVFPNLPGKITIHTKTIIYPDLTPQKMYPDLGVESMYFIWAKTLLNELDIKYGTGEVTRDYYYIGKYPKLKLGQWYDKDRISMPDDERSTFWKASLYNTLNDRHYLYHTIEQRHAYYKFVDAYLKTKGIISEWFDAAARVTMGSIETALNGEMALGAPEMPLNLWFLSDETDEFLKGGNKYLFADNMNNVKLLLKGKGKLSGEFIDAKGNKQSFKNLSKQELDFKLVEFEQTLVQDYINSSFKDLNNSFLKKSFDEVSETTGNKEFDDIVKQINKNFALWMAPDIIEDIMEKYFTKNGKVIFNFAKYEDRVKLGQILVKELYYLKLSDTFKIDNFDKIIENPRENSRKTRYFRIDQKDAVKEKPKYLKEFKLFDRLSRIKKKLKEKSIYILVNLDEVVIAFLNTGISIFEEVIYSLIDIEEEITSDLEELYDEIKEEFERTKLSNHYSETYIDYIKNLYENIVEINEIRKMLKEKIVEKIEEKGKKIQHKVKEEFNQLPYEIAGNAIEKVANQIYPGIRGITDEDRKQSLFRKSSDATVAILLYEFATGTGKQSRDFDFYKHKFAQAILKDRIINEIMEETLKLLIQTNYDFVNKPDSKELKIDLEFSPTPTYLIESIDKHFDSNLAQIVIGGAFALVRIRKGKLEGYIYNETSRESLILHLNVGDIHRKDDGSKERSLSTIVQRIYFTFKLPK
ncbi:hypothetical protein FLA105534_03477 [Flavobacterium bizetiae]|uniref:Uncharacterized protein n=1 Tax=Flavobacterium bizetiae TaxID=2704140 RepID=A0A6J4GT72_9FLAO|nr:hypothetical protein [Flavobacterium bizetiae]CAA9201225.1 hypothetical protein FLA105534_03477 [Flavobacterium bizetiae]CAD5340488.1 hypothetical protein FLA105535_00442 [Flavobacterium bizetiae]CAD5346893.1 hypothetical protein FLA105534_00836 [Flavobacterium bizetiae]